MSHVWYKKCREKCICIYKKKKKIQTKIMIKNPKRFIKKKKRFCNEIKYRYKNKIK